MATQEQIDSFHQFALKQVQNGGANLSMTELFDLWQIQNPSPEELAENVRAVQHAITDMENGDTGRPVEEFIDEIRKEFDIPPGE